jgi:hypothetical protein
MMIPRRCVCPTHKIVIACRCVCRTHTMRGIIVACRCVVCRTVTRTHTMTGIIVACRCVVCRTVTRTHKMMIARECVFPTHRMPMCLSESHDDRNHSSMPMYCLSNSDSNSQHDDSMPMFMSNSHESRCVCRKLTRSHCTMIACRCVDSMKFCL